MLESKETLDPNVLAKTRLAFIGCGVMAEAIIAGLLRKQLVAPEQIVGSHPRSARRDEIQQKFGVQIFEHNCDATKAVHPTAAYPNSLIILAVKPQRLIGVLHDLKGSIPKDQLIISIVAGAKIATIADELQHRAIVRTMYPKFGPGRRRRTELPTWVDEFPADETRSCNHHHQYCCSASTATSRSSH